MNARELVLLSPYRLPAQHPLTLANDDMAAWLNGNLALWHPAALRRASAPPRVESAYDHENPRPGHIYAVPESPPSLLPDDWEQRLRAAGAIAFKAAPDRRTTLANLQAALTATPQLKEGEPQTAPQQSAPGQDDPAGTARLVELDAGTIAPFFGIGIGYMLLAALSEAMEHENLLESNDFWIDMQLAVAAVADLPVPADTIPPERSRKEIQTESWKRRRPNQEVWEEPPSENEPPPPVADGASAAEPEPPRSERRLQSAATRLLSAREMLYPVTIHLLDIRLVDDRQPKHWPGHLKFGQPTNVIASASALEKLQRECPEHFASLAERAKTGLAEICGGGHLEREDPLLPIESQFWNLRKGLAVTQALVGTPVKVFARRRFGVHPQLPTWLNQFGISKALLLPLDYGALPTYSGTVVNWSTQDGKQIDGFVRKPYPADSVETFFNLGHYLFKTTREDHTATLAFLHPAPPRCRGTTT